MRNPATVLGKRKHRHFFTVCNPIIVMRRRKQPSKKSNKGNTNYPLSQVTKHLIWFWSLERIWCFDCVFGVYSFALVLNGEVAMLGWLEWWWLGVFIASKHFLAVGWLCCRWAHWTVRWCTRHCTIHYPVSATSVDRWSLELLTVEVFCPLAAPDNPVYPDVADWLLQSAQSTVGQSWPLLHCLIEQSGGAPDSPMNYRGRAPWKPESGQFARCLAKVPDSVQCTTGCTRSCMLQTL
jgi:hypothetical protein